MANDAGTTLLEARVAALTHQGRVRASNEDCIAVGGWVRNEPMAEPRSITASLDAPLVCLAIDGMGGHAGGEVAALLAAESLAKGLPGCVDDQAVTGCIRAANARIYERMKEDRRLTGMGATLAGIRIAADGVCVFNVGDSRVYRVQDGFLSQLSVDDVPGPGARSGAITQSLGGLARFTEVRPHLSRQPLSAPRTWLLCSDGLYDALELDAMEKAIDDDPAASASRLLAGALAAGAPDNVSIIVVRVVSASAGS